jgi:hypothetical protein
LYDISQILDTSCVEMDQNQQLVISEFNNEDSEKKIFIGTRSFPDLLSDALDCETTSGPDLVSIPSGEQTRSGTTRPSVSEIIRAAVSQAVKQHQEIQERFRCKDEKELSQVLKEIYREIKNTKTFAETTATKESSIPLSNE